ncbi:WD repeat-containing protein 93 [Rhynochetos jubatus]
MSVYVWKHPLEIPPPSEKDWLKEDEEDFFLQDPDQKRDALPQPFRMVNKLVMLVFENAMEIIERREMLREAEKLKIQPTKYFPTAEFQVTGRANCLAVSGKYVFVGLSVGLAAFRVSDCKEVCAWDAVKMEICAIHASDLGNERYVLLAVDEMGLVWLFCLHEESFLLIKILNEMEDISKQSTCVEVVLSPGGGYAGVLLQGNTKAWLEIYRLPKDSWLKETEKNPGAAAGLACRERRSSLSPSLAPADSDSKIQAEQVCQPRGMKWLAFLLPLPETCSFFTSSIAPSEEALHKGYLQEESDGAWPNPPEQRRKNLELHGNGSADMESPVSANKADAKLSLPVLLLKVKPPKPVTGSSFKSPLDALKKVDDDSTLGLGYDHLIKDSQWEQQEAIFSSTYREYLEAKGERESQEEIPRNATFHFLLPSWILQVGPEMKVQPDVPAGISVHWHGNHNLCFYLLNRPIKEKVDSDPKPDVVWPCAAPIACSAVSSCSRYLALACEDAAITIWDKHLGYPLSVTAILEERLIRSIHFLRHSAAASDETPCPGTDPACPIVQLLVLCADSSLHLVKAPRARQSSITLLADRTQVPVVLPPGLMFNQMGFCQFLKQVCKEQSLGVSCPGGDRLCLHREGNISRSLFYGPEDPNLAISAVVPVLAFPSAALVFCWDGTVSLMNTATAQIVYCFSTPPSHVVASPWQPVFIVDRVNWCLLLRGDKQQQADALAQSRASHSTIFLFDFNSYPLKEAFPKEPDLPLKSLQNLPWMERCNIFLRDRFVLEISRLEDVPSTLSPRLQFSWCIEPMPSLDGNFEMEQFSAEKFHPMLPATSSVPPSHEAGEKTGLPYTRKTRETPPPGISFFLVTESRANTTAVSPVSTEANRQQSLLGLREQLPEYWSQLQAQAAAMDKEREKAKGQKKPKRPSTHVVQLRFRAESLSPPRDLEHQKSMTGVLSSCVWGSPVCLIFCCDPDEQAASSLCLARDLVFSNRAENWP